MPHESQFDRQPAGGGFAPFHGRQLQRRMLIDALHAAGGRGASKCPPVEYAHPKGVSQRAKQARQTNWGLAHWQDWHIGTLEAPFP